MKWRSTDPRSSTMRCRFAPGLHDRPELLPEDRAQLHRPASLREESRSTLSGDSGADRPAVDLAGPRSPGQPSQPEAGGMGELLLPGWGRESLPARDGVHGPTAPPVVGAQ